MWWAIAVPNKKGTSNWYIQSGTRSQIEKSHPGAVIKEFPTRKAAQTYVELQGGGRQPVKGPPHKNATTTKPAPSGAAIVAAARTWLGVPYQYGGTSRQGVDCSGLILNVANEVGVKNCPRTSEAQWLWCDHIKQDETGPGDLVFFVGAEIDPPPGHVGILVTRNEMIDAPFTGTVVRYDKFSDGPGPNKIIGYGRMRGAVHSTTANPYVQDNSASAAVTAIAGGVSMSVVFIVVIILIILVFFLLIATGLIFH